MCSSLSFVVSCRNCTQKRAMMRGGQLTETDRQTDRRLIIQDPSFIVLNTSVRRVSLLFLISFMVIPKILARGGEGKSKDSPVIHATFAQSPCVVIIQIREGGEQQQLD